MNLQTIYMVNQRPEDSDVEQDFPDILFFMAQGAFFGFAGINLATFGFFNQNVGLGAIVWIILIFLDLRS